MVINHHIFMGILISKSNHFGHSLDIVLDIVLGKGSGIVLGIAFFPFFVWICCSVHFPGIL